MLSAVSSKVKLAYSSAISSKSIVFTESRLEKLYDEALKVTVSFSIRIEFIRASTISLLQWQIRFAPSLAKKPTTDSRDKSAKPHPFLPPYDPALFVEEDEDHVILVNRSFTTQSPG
jgi:ATP adenylyltransferase/5',5'''-P-1,P-4-tetraphosphate phosphorylase II